MKESISAVSIFQIVILFILLFTAIMCLTINNANAFGVKDEITNIIELNDGKFLTSDGNLSEDIVATIDSTAYRTIGKCSEGYTGFQRDGSKVNAGDRASICIKCMPVTANADKYLSSILGNKVASGDSVNSYYYQVEVFYQLDLPVIREAYDFKTRGETKLLFAGAANLCEEA